VFVGFHVLEGRADVVELEHCVDRQLRFRRRRVRFSAIIYATAFRRKRTDGCGARRYRAGLSDCKSAGRRQSTHPIENSTQTPRCDTSGEQAPQGRI
jgi:hypothetical protein